MRAASPESIPLVSRRTALRAGIGAAVASSLSGCLSSVTGDDESFPSQSIRMIVPYDEGGGSDTYARTLSPIVGDILGVNIEVENIPGGAALRGLGELARAEPDGYTLGVYSPPPNAIAALVQEPDFDPVEYTPIGVMGTSGMVSISNPDLPSDFKELAQLYRDGELEDMGGISRGSTAHATALFFANDEEYNIPNNYVGYSGGSPTVQAVASGEVPVGISTTTSALSAVESGDVNLAAVHPSGGSDVYPDAKSLVDYGFPQMDFLAQFFRGIAGPGGIPDDRAETLINSFEEAITGDEFQSWGEETGNSTRYLGPEKLEEATERALNELPQKIEVDKLRGN